MRRARSDAPYHLYYHVADGAVPVGVTGGSTDGAGLHRIDLARSQTRQGGPACQREDAPSMR